MIKHINRKNWWHVVPSDPEAYQKRGKFFASTFAESEFWGRPCDNPFRVTVSNPLIGDESSIQMDLLGFNPCCPPLDSTELLEWRWDLDARLKKSALAKGYDSIVLMSPNAYIRFVNEGKIPRSIELNTL